MLFTYIVYLQNLAICFYSFIGSTNFGLTYFLKQLFINASCLLAQRIIVEQNNRRQRYGCKVI